MFKCLDCCSVFEDTLTIKENMGECHGAVMYNFTEVCPYCQADDVEILEVCAGCGDYVEGGLEYCGICIDDIADGLKETLVEEFSRFSSAVRRELKEILKDIYITDILPDNLSAAEKKYYDKLLFGDVMKDFPTIKKNESEDK